MTRAFELACAYVIGGITFLPVLLLLVLLHAYLTFPHRPSTPRIKESIADAHDDGQNLRSGKDVLDFKLQKDTEKEFGGYFAVCREWIPGGINGKPPERTTPAGEVIAEESPSVYQSMYRSIFERRQIPTMEVNKTNGRYAKRARNVFYIVLRHGHLMLYDDSEQIEVRHVVSLAHHDVSIYGGGEVIPEGELWIKRNAICLARKQPPSSDNIAPVSKPFYLFSDNCSEKEDFYFAILQNQERDDNARRPLPQIQTFDGKHVVQLVQALHSSEEHLQTRWFNALVGRLFLSIYKTSEIEDFIRNKIIKKISRVNKPAFLSGIQVKGISLGSSAPFLTNPRLKDLTVEGDCCVEADVNYSGDFRIEVATTAKIDLGTRFKAREVDLVLAITLKKLEGHLLVRFKPPPSNRIWIAFEQMPNLSMHIEPIVSSRQITYNFILRAIESRIREVVAETLVLPHWDDNPFLDTSQKDYRGGIWVNEQQTQARTDGVVPDDTIQDTIDIPNLEEDAVSTGLKSSAEASMSTPTLVESQGQSQGLSARRSKQDSKLTGGDHHGATSSAVQKPADLSRAMRSRSFASVANPVVSTEVSSPTRAETKHTKDAASFMTELSNRSHPGSPSETPASSYGSHRSSMLDTERPRVTEPKTPSSHISDAELSTPQKIMPEGLSTPTDPPTPGLSSRSTTSSTDSSSKTSKLQNVARGLTPSEKKQQSIAAAAVAARNWGWKAISRAKNAAPEGNLERAGTPENPIGRGRPLPPPGQPLPRPNRRSPVSSFILQKGQAAPMGHHTAGGPTQDDAKGRPIPFSPRRRSTLDESANAHEGGEGLLVVEAPEDSEPEPDSTAEEDDFGEYLENVKSEEETTTPVTSNSQHQPASGDTREDSLSGSDGTDDVPIRRGDLYSTSYEDDGPGLPSWQRAQEGEARSRSVWMDEPEHS